MIRFTPVVLSKEGNPRQICFHKIFLACLSQVSFDMKNSQKPDFIAHSAMEKVRSLM